MIGFLCALPLVARLAMCAAPQVLAVGYVEGEYVNLAPVTAATLTEVIPRQGERVTAGEVVARQERADAEIALAEAEAARGRAEAELANLREGSRPEEIAVTEATLEAARVRLREAERQAERQTALAERGVVQQADLETVLAARDTAQTEVAQLEAELTVKRLPARSQVVAAAESQLRGAEAAVRDARWRLEQRDLVAPADGRISDVFRRVGEIAGPTAPVLSLLPDGAWKLVVFVAEAEVAGIAPGDRLDVRCDGCPPGLTATVSYVSDEPEFTPPVIFSVENRQKLVYR
ncbi:MAG TPA: HlyD family efflux transporter periplasmic adaptor subunit, partial [Amaricoccus sp.]|nr:HlyD family efflux transporter periplasmic adaptor subunit [Amaricoccus sp.]